MDQEEITKTCTKCGETKPLSEFYNQKGRKFGKSPRCKACAKNQNDKYYLEHREATLERQTEYAKNNPDVGRRSQKKYYATHTEEVRSRARLNDATTPEDRAERRRRTKTGSPLHSLFIQTRSRAKQSGIPFTIDETELFLPEICPVLGIPLLWTEKSRSGNTPSVDRKVPELGYVPGNVAIISWRANRLKNDGTAEEFHKIADWMDTPVEKSELVAV